MEALVYRFWRQKLAPFSLLRISVAPLFYTIDNSTDESKYGDGEGTSLRSGSRSRNRYAFKVLINTVNIYPYIKLVCIQTRIWHIEVQIQQAQVHMLLYRA